MKIDVKEYRCPPGFPDNAAKSVSLSEGQGPISSRDDLRAAINQVREDFPGQILVIERGSCARGWKKEHELPAVDGDFDQQGWHIHRGYDTVNVGRGSHIPTLIAADAAKAAGAILQSLNPITGPLQASRFAGYNLDIGWRDEEREHVVEQTLSQHLRQLHERLVRIARGSVTEPAIVQRDLDHFRHFAALLEDNSLVTGMFRGAQGHLPVRSRLALVPADFDAYVIPEDAVHARSALHSASGRHPAKQNLGMCIDRGDRNGELYHYHGQDYHPK